ncbi:ATP-binding cassette domain-containing protein [Paenilisteria rocourtiae]|uniref:ABC-2 type transport system ATP-binding protein n=1 Tax=Listeria rocourtiae TaxID=647910 RepID=A0A4V3DPA2_9LIST|nr:ABC transporter ATP-binding protein [Listeria rocourtiae]EUJ47446.1 ABC transporter ATP-binding protein [Listeria rocourtiae FSL F6-920]MBC1435419.1 ABC transporter ATP-binding protein [Listeria rocourtiae]TDR51556.1 ABC-2 type transport system ATP-binding protein [Listeria rocourtiae]
MIIDRITKRIEGNLVLENISFELKAGEITALIGRNGVGKTTLFSIIAGMYLADAGQVMLDGQDLRKNPALKKNIFFLEDNMNYFNTYSVKAVVKIYKNVYATFDEEFFNTLMERFELPTKAKVMSFSKGRKALFFMILAFSLDVRYLLLDEPLDGLDVIVKKQLLQFILETVADRKTSVLIASHRLDELEMVADRVLVLKGTSLELDYYLEALRDTALKIQVAFKSKHVPAFVKEESELLQRNGRIYTLLVTENTDDFVSRLKLVEPILYQEMAITMEDVFTIRLSDDKVDYYEI